MKNKGLQIGIVSGVISSLIVLLFIQPLLTFIWTVVVRVGTTFHQGYVDAIYKNAARGGNNNMVGHMTLLLIMLVVLSVLLLLIFPRDATALHVRITGNIVRGFAVAAIVVSTMAALFVQSLAFGVMQLEVTFEQRLAVLAPVISDPDYKTFRARWATMQNRGDYDSITAAMEAAAKPHGIKLPKLPAL